MGDYTYYYGANDAMFGGMFAGAVTGVLVVASIFSIVISILTIIANWKIFTKAGEAGWKCLIPIYNLVILFKIAGISPWLLLVYLATWIPIIGPLASLGITIYSMISLAKAFGKGGGFATGLILLNTIFIMILAFSDAKYQLGNNVDNNNSSPIEPQSL